MHSRELEDRQRRRLVQALASGAFAVPALSAPLFGQVPGPLPAGRSFYLLDGDVRVDGAAATRETRVAPTAVVETGSNGRAAFVVGKDAFLMRPNSRLELSGDDGGTVVQGLRLVTGALLSVFGRSRHRVTTSTATIGIRGTGIYCESAPDRSYVCTCYGVVDIAAQADPRVHEEIVSRQHDQPRWVLAEPVDGRLIEPAPMIDHTDDELLMLEALVGRELPFPPQGSYDRPRRQRY